MNFLPFVKQRVENEYACKARRALHLSVVKRKSLLVTEEPA